MFEIKGIVPGCFVDYKNKTGEMEEARVLAMLGNDRAIIQFKDSAAITTYLKYCTLKYAVVGNTVYDLNGGAVRKL